MDYTLIAIEVVSAAICFVLVWFMIKPYRTNGEVRYLGLPLAFAFLGAAYIMTSTAYFEPFPLAVETRWLRLFTQTYAFTFLAITYYFSRQRSKNAHLRWNLTYAAIILAAVFSYLIVIEPLVFGFGLPSYKSSNQFLLLFNLLLLAYISYYTLRNHAANPDPKTIWIPIGYLLLAFGQYSLFIASVDSSVTATIGAQVLRLSALLILLFVAYQVFYVSNEETAKTGGTGSEENSA